MKYYAPQHKQLPLDLVRSSLENLDKSNRWVQMGDNLPWSDIEKEYNSKIDNMSEFTDKPIFDSSLFVTIRKRICEEEINAMTTKQQRILEEHRKQAEQDTKDKGEEPPKPEAEDPNAAEFTNSQNRKHNGGLKIDATCADAEVRYPVDSTLLETACRKIDEYTSKVCKEFGITGKNTHYKDVRHSYLLLIKQKVKKGRLVKDTIAYLLNCLTKDLRQLLNIFAEDYKRYEFLFLYEKRVITAIIKMMHHQDEMQRTGVHSCPSRIVSIFQVRGKAGANVEFGAMIAQASWKAIRLSTTTAGMSTTRVLICSYR